MSNTRCELLNPKLFPLMAIIAVSLLLPIGHWEVLLLWAYCLYVTIDHVYYGISVVSFCVVT